MEPTHALDRWLYRGRRPNRLARLINGATARLAAAGIGPAQLVMLEVAGRRTGKAISFPVVVADYQGERYLVSMLGDETSWVRNVRAANGRAVLRRGRREVIQLEEVDPGGAGRHLAPIPRLLARGKVAYPDRPRRPLGGVRAHRREVPGVPRDCA